MPDEKKVEVKLVAKSDTKDLEKFVDAQKEVKESIDEVTDSINPMLAGLEESRKKKLEEAKASDKVTEELKEESKARKENAESIKRESQSSSRQRSAPRSPIENARNVRNDFRNTFSKSLKNRGLSRFSKSLTGVNSKLLSIGKAVGRGGIVFAAIQLLGVAFKEVTGFIGKAGEKVSDFGDDMEITGQKGSRFVQWLGNKAKALGEVGKKTGMILNPLGAYIKATKEAAEAERESIKLTKQINKEREALIRRSKKEVNAINERIKATQKFEEIAKFNTKAAIDFENAVTKSNDALDFQLQKLDLLKDARLQKIDSDEQEALDRIDNNDSLSEDQKEGKRFNTSRKASQARERITQGVFSEQQSILEDRRLVIEDQANKLIKRINQLGDLGRGILSEEQKGEFEKLSRDDQVAASPEDKTKAQLALADDARAKKRLANTTDDGGNALDNEASFSGEVQRLKAELTNVKRELSLLDSGNQITLGRERIRREGVKDDFQNRRRDEGARLKEASQRENLRNQESGFNTSSAEAASKFEQAAKQGLNSGRRADAELLRKISESLEDGATRAEIQKAGQELRSIYETTNSETIRSFQVVIQRLKQQEKDLAALKMKLNNRF